MELEALLGIDPRNPLQIRAKRLVEEDESYLDALVAMRKAKGLSQEAIADRMEISQGAVARIESGERDPRLSTLRRYAMAVGAVYSHDVMDDEPRVVKSPIGDHRAAEDSWPLASHKVSGRRG
ncbi:helix-turn-helix domain-containing protein [Nocardioides sp. CPCC 206347]|uniref:helix-turn-helix domain-containing protein n=1 Tax=unclassified Nocardioides TaxID=2615069 RepID=UPI00361F34E1